MSRMDIARAVFGASPQDLRAEAVGGTSDATVSLRFGTVKADSADGTVEVLLDGSADTESNDYTVVLPTSEDMAEGDRVQVVMAAGLTRVLPVDGGVTDAAKTATDYLTLDDDGLHVGDESGGEVVIDSDSLDIMTASGIKAATFAYDSQGRLDVKTSCGYIQMSNGVNTGKYLVGPDGCFTVGGNSASQVAVTSNGDVSIMRTDDGVTTSGSITDWVTSRESNDYNGYTETWASGKVVAYGTKATSTAPSSAAELGFLPSITAFKSGATKAKAVLAAHNGDWDACQRTVIGVSANSSGQVVNVWDSAPSGAHRVNFRYELW